MLSLVPGDGHALEPVGTILVLGSTRWSGTCVSGSMLGLRLWYWFWSLCTWGWTFSLSLWGPFMENGNTRASLDLGPTRAGGAGVGTGLELWAMGPAWHRR